MSLYSSIRLTIRRLASVSIRKATRVRQVGLARGVKGLVQNAQYRLLTKEFGLPRWHMQSPFHWSPYKPLVVSIASRDPRQTLVEIGCGLGEIVARIDAAKKIGLDSDARALNAARKLNRHVLFCQGTFETAPEQLYRLGVRSVDTVIAVNLGTSLETKLQGLEDLVSEFKVQRIIADEPTPNENTARVVRNFASTRFRAAECSVPHEVRRLWIFDLDMSH